MPTRVKICGIKSVDIMRSALDAGADDVGLVFFEKSPRNVRLADAVRLADSARGRARIVVLTVDADDAALDSIMRGVRPDVLQLHGDETPARCHAIKTRWQVQVMKAIGVAVAADLARALEYAAAVDLVLFDAKAADTAILPGGNGLAFDWSLIGRHAPPVPFMLGGGLTPQNVAEAIRITHAHAVDVSSGVETAPGEKDPGLIRAFIAAANRDIERHGNAIAAKASMGDN